MLVSRRALVAGAASWPLIRSASAASEVTFAFVSPLSGAWAREGQLQLGGAQMAVDDVNAAGGIKSLGGAKVRLVTYDAGDSAEKAKNATQRMVAEQPAVSGGLDGWLSTFTLAITEVTERARIPWFTQSYSDLITGRGFKYVFQSSPTAVDQAEKALPTILDLAQRTTGKRPKKIAILADNTASSVSFLKPIRGHVLHDLGLTPVVDEVFTPPLTDATTLIQKIRSARPDFLLALPSNVGDDKMILDGLGEYGLSGGKLPVIGNGGHWATPELVANAGKSAVQGLMVITAAGAGKGLEDIERRYMARTKEPWMLQEPLMAYGHIMLLAKAVDQAGSADRQKVAEQIRAFDFRDGPAKLFPGNHIKYDANGRRVDAELMILQWQDGRPVTTNPASMAVAKAIWPTPE
ncbi:MAG TPA: ABC transporter substrate-binding protein [Rhodopila sp.]|uniref:ABC transporter substrate-binding protein n=1 Tax=Rhodopila sp. TaxID=2480087 RepID=UPI002B698E13|nr:ABC transporter substrate-binding protein [Rhodopila sp.]HVY17068.1 ABC transporter substrate-binding protein [Rhodopila sp.]